MMMLKRMICGALLAGISAAAFAGAGSWSADGYGGQTQFGRQAFSGRTLEAPAAESLSGARVTSVAWSISASSADVTVKLCASEANCLTLPGVSGTMTWPESAAPRAGDSFRFVYLVNQPGRLAKPFSVNNNALTVNYAK
ncbi:flagellar protein FlhE [Apirhabdus apintestini]|nr:flagellar protein FlhE [Enterobacteriaceae bacterium CA-0114]